MNAYWRNREEQNQREYLLEEDEYVDRLQDILDYTLDQIDREISDFYTRYASKEGITYAEATQRVSQLDMDEYERKAKKYVSEKDFSDKANEEMRLYNLTMKVNRLELLKSNIGLELVNNFMIIDDEMKGYLTERAISEYTRQAGILGMTVKDSARKAEALVNASFRHATFSDRIWMYQSQLKSAIDVLLREGIIQGQGPLELARQLDKLFDTGKYNCERLMRTELTRVQSAAQLDSFITNGFEEYQFNALGDACKICAALDERHFKITDAMPGENLPPIHPNCRCAVSAWMDDVLYNQWLDTYPQHGMNYEDWLANRPQTILEQVQAEDASKTYKQMLDWYDDDEGDYEARDYAHDEWQELTSKDITENEEARIYTGYIGTTQSYYLNDILRVYPNLSPTEIFDVEDNMTINMYETAKALDAAISKNQLQQDTILTRYLTDDAIQDIFGIDTSVLNTFENRNADANDLFGDLIGGIIQENGYVSASGNETLNVFRSERENKVEIYAPSGTNALITDNFDESEVILRRGTKYVVTGLDTEYDEDLGGYFVIKVRVIE